MTFKQNHKRLFALLLMAVLFLCPVSVMAEDAPAAVSAEETTASAESVLPQSEEAALPGKTEEAASVSAPETTAAPVPPTVTEAPAATAAPKATAAPAATSAPAAQKEPEAAPFESGYAWAPADTRLYTGRSQSEDALLVQLPYSVYLYVKDCRGSWAELIVALRTEEGVQVTEAYVPLYHLELVPEKEQADAAASVFSKAHTDYHGITIRIVSLAEREAEPAPEIPAEAPVEEAGKEPAEESTEEPEVDAPEVTDVSAEEIVETPAEEPAEEPAEVPEADASEVPAEETVETPVEEPVEVPAADAPEVTETAAEEPVPEVSVFIRTHAASPVHIGDSVTLEAVTEGFDHEPVFFWEFRLPDGDKWYPYEGENGSKLTFFVNRYNSCYIWRVTAE